MDLPFRQSKKQQKEETAGDARNEPSKVELAESNLERILEKFLSQLNDLLDKNKAGTGAVETEKPVVPEVEEAVKETAEAQPVPEAELAKVVTGLEKLDGSVKQLLAQVEDFTYKDKINKELHKELQAYKSGLRREFIMPLLNGVIRQHDKVIDQYRFYEVKQAEEDTDKAALFPILLKEYKNLADNLEDLLYDYDVETVTPQAGEDYNPRLHKSVQSVPTSDAANERKIAACIHAGFKDSGIDKLLKQPEVAVYKWTNN